MSYLLLPFLKILFCVSSNHPTCHVSNWYQCESRLSLREITIYDVYEELEKPDEDEILFINKILDGKFGFSNNEKMGLVFHTSLISNNDNYDVIIDGESCVNVASIDMNVEYFEFDLDATSHESNLDVASFEQDLDHNTFEFDMVSEFVKLFTNGYQVQKSDLIADFCGCSLFYKDIVSSSYHRASIEDESDWKIKCKMKEEQNLCKWMVIPLIKPEVDYVNYYLKNAYLKDSRTSPKLEGEYDTGASSSFYIQYPSLEKQVYLKNYNYFGAEFESPHAFGFKPPWKMKIHF